MYIRDWWWHQQMKKLAGSKIVPVIGSSNQTRITHYAGDWKLWPVYISLGNMDTSIPCKRSNGCCILLALLPVPPKYTFNGKGCTAALKLQQEYDREMQWRVNEMIVKPLEEVAENGKFMHCAVG
ncbi:hypothetical protein FPQ18DRAFT_233577, partial [Pyronema domesticum]